MKQFSIYKKNLTLLVFTMASVLAPVIIFSDEAPDYYFTLSEKLKAVASSVLVEPGKSKSRYSAEKAMDGKLETSWCEGKEDDGLGESIEFKWKPTLVEALIIGHGVLLNRKYYELNNRIKEFELTVNYSTGRKEIKNAKFGDYSCNNNCEALRLDGDALEACQLEKKNTCQFENNQGYFVGGESISITRGCVIGVSLKILSVFPGKKFRDTCISEIQLQIPDPKYPEAKLELEKESKACK